MKLRNVGDYPSVGLRWKKKRQKSVLLLLHFVRCY